MVAIAEDEGVVSNAKTRISARCKRGAADDHVDRAQGKTLVDVGFFAQSGGGENLNFKFAVGAFFDFVGSPHRFSVISLRSFVHVRPFQFGLRLRNAAAHGA